MTDEPKSVRKTLLDDAPELAVKYKHLLSINLPEELRIVLDKFEMMLNKPEQFQMLQDERLELKRQHARLETIILKLERKKSGTS